MKQERLKINWLSIQCNEKSKEHRNKEDKKQKFISRESTPHTHIHTQQQQHKRCAN